MKKILVRFFWLAALAGSVYAYLYVDESHRNGYVKLPDALTALTGFTDCASFVAIPQEVRKYRYREHARSEEAYLRFCIPKFTPTGYVLTLKLKAELRILEGCVMRSAKGTGGKCQIADGVGTFVIDMDPADQFLWDANQCCYVGVAFQKSTLKNGDEVELVDFKFELK